MDRTAKRSGGRTMADAPLIPSDQPRALTQVQAWSVLDQFAANARVGYLDEPSGVAEVFRSLTRRDRPATNTWSDAYIAAVSLQAGMVVATMDQDFLELGAPSLVLS